MKKRAFNAVCGLLILLGGLIPACTSTSGDPITVEQARAIAGAKRNELDQDKPITQKPREGVVIVAPPWVREEEGRDESEAVAKMKIIALRVLARDEDLADVSDVYGDTVLHKAALVGDLGALREFVEKGAKINARSNNGDTPLHRAVKGGHESAVKFLLSVGADPNARGLSGESPLFLTKNIRIMRILVEAGADPNQADIGGCYPVCFLDSPEDLLALGADPGLVIKTDGNTILMNCLLYYWDSPESKEEVGRKVDALIKYGADVRQKSPDGYTSLMMAAETENVDMVKKLISMGVDPRAKDKNGKTALDYTRRHSNHYQLKNDGHDWMMGEKLEDNENLRKIRKILGSSK